MPPQQTQLKARETNMAYRLARSILFQLAPETAHHISLKALALGHRAALLRALLPPIPPASATLMGLEFPNPIGLAAGLDKTGTYIDALGNLGFGFIEIGTVTPRPQPGNPKPRIFRLPQAQALINRMGFNNPGVDALLENVQKSHYSGVLGINIGKNRDTPLEQAVDDYLICLRKVYAHADYVTVNISSPNTPGLRDLQQGDNLERLLSHLKETQLRLASEQQRYVPLIVKIAPDLNTDEIADIGQTLLDHDIDGVIASNTTSSRQGVEGLPYAHEAGGLSGKPLTDLATSVVQELHNVLQGRLPIIAAGGIMNGTDAQAKLKAGASLVQLYTGLIYRGPTLIREVAEALKTEIA